MVNLLRKAQFLYQRLQANDGYWQVLYSTPQKISGSEIVSEYDCSWEQLPKYGKIAARLVCPNNELGVLELNGKDLSDRLFHFGIGLAIQGVGRIVQCRVLGAVYGLNGECLIHVWEPPNNRHLGPLEDTFPHMKYGGPVTNNMNQLILGAKAD